MPDDPNFNIDMAELARLVFGDTVREFLQGAADQLTVDFTIDNHTFTTDELATITAAVDGAVVRVNAYWVDLFANLMSRLLENGNLRDAPDDTSDTST